MDARTSLTVSLNADTDISIKSGPTGVTWIEFGSAAVFANEDQLRRLGAVITDHLSPRGPVLKVEDMTTAEFIGHMA